MNIFLIFKTVLLLMFCKLYSFNGTTLGPANSNVSVKASTKPTDYLDHITIIAHIANGITLQAGLMNGTIPINEVVGEMLNLGSANVSDLINYKPDKILELIKKLKEVRQSVAANDKTTKMETRALEWEDYRLRSEFIGDVTNLTGSVEYFEAVENFQRDFNSSLFENTEELFKDFSEHFTVILENSLTSTLFPNSGYYNLKYFNETFQSLKELLIEIKAFNRTSFDILLNGPNIFKSLDTVIKLSALRKNYFPLYTEDGENLIKRNIDLASALSAVNEASRSDMMTVSKLSDRLVSIPSRKYTSGFSRGLIDMEQLRDGVQNQWFFEMTNATEMDGQSIQKSLEPMLSAFQTMHAVNKKLKVPFPEHTKFQQFKDEPYFIPVNANSSVDVVKKYEDCDGKGHSDDYRKKGVEFIENVKTVSDWLTAFDNFTRILDLDQLEKDVSAFVKSLNFTDINDQTQSVAEVIEIVKNIRNSTGLKNIQESVKGVENQFNAVRLDSLKNDVFPKISDVFRKDENFKKVINVENSVNKCLQNVKNESLVISEAIKTIQKLRVLDDNLLESVRQTATSVAQFSDALPTVTSIPDAMKKGVKNVTLELNQMSLESLNQSDGIGISASALQNIFSLLDLESSINQLKSVDGIVKVGIDKSSNKSELKSLWGNHNHDISSLEGAIAKSKDFVSKIDVSKAHTLFSYSTPLKNLSTIPDVQIDAVKKSKALEILISSLVASSVKKRKKRDTKSDLLAAKETLEKISVLDLQFSSHSTQFQNVPSAFQSFDNFLQLFFASQQPISAPPPIPQNNGGDVNTGGTGSGTSNGGPIGDTGTVPTGSGTGVGQAAVVGSSTASTVSNESSDFPILFVVIPVVLILVVLVIGGIVFFWNRRREEKCKEKEAEEENEKLIPERKRMEAIKEEEERVKAEREKVKKEEERLKAEEEKVKVEKEKVKAEEEKVKVEKERNKEKVKAEEERLKAEEEKVKIEKEKVKAEEQKIKAAEEERRKERAEDAKKVKEGQEKIAILNAKVQEKEDKSEARRKQKEMDNEAEKLLNVEKEKEKRKIIEKWIMSKDYKDDQRTAKFCNTTIESVNASTIDKDHITESYTYLPEDKHRFPNVPCKPSTAVEVIVDGQRVPIHANWIPTPGHPHRFIATQGPLTNTCEDFWMMLMQYDVEHIVMFGQKRENLTDMCTDYFPLWFPFLSKTKNQLKIGRFEIKIKNTEYILNKKINQRTLEVVDSTGKFATRTLMHYQYSEWTGYGVPKSHAELFDLMEIVKKSEKPIVVHCSNGIGRSMAFIGTECLAREVEADPTIELTEALKHVREHRWNGVQTNSQLYWMTLGTMYRLIKEYGFDMKMYEKQMAMFTDVVNRLLALDTISKYSDALCDEKKSDENRDELVGRIANVNKRLAGIGKKK
ncbi:Protein-tyrosine-phosphatase [Caenorhabditis elegans]|uniref:Protein-tyrosine-phosphatase n=1 Tax=Caenorhabditis elegans TaxID=6239 RepID=Q8MYN1_CAEEL|nr:Protein-tyrosine-phosphatase [Caenorhabditis elegans]pir/T45039/ hypothetical protein Y39B6B.m [imported] - Caenorhabditis elegans [Caenorhabditis elegans]CAD31825.2 Protein-tyrosine-phosphatase [Caenorhabditis elegans]|eukprot:NP_741667.2 Uncharacterized protein CELE_Y39B6A.30 [Caenorhabditis elegans]